MARPALPSSLSSWHWMGLRVEHKLAESSTPVHSKGKGKHTHVYTHQAPLSSHSASPSCPLSPTLVWGYSPWMKGEHWEDLLSCSLEWTNSGADSVLLGAARSCKERWMSFSADCWALAGEASPVIDELTQRPPLCGSNWRTLTKKNTILFWGSYMFKRKGTEIRNRHFVNWADVGKWLRGRADSIIESSAVAAQTTGSFHSSTVIKIERLWMHWWGLKHLWRALSLCGFLFVLPGLSHCSQPGGPWSRRLSYWEFISELFWLINLNLAQINLFLSLDMYLCPLSVINKFL